MADTTAKHARISSRLRLSSFLCFSNRGPAEPSAEPRKPVHQLDHVPPQSAKPSGLLVRGQKDQPDDIAVSRGSTSCYFLEHLPLELRLRIYEYALGGQTIHLVHMRNDSVQWPFESASPMITSMIGADWDPLKADPWEPPIISLALLLTCRRIYNEAADILYSSNFFATDNVRVLMYLAESCLSPQRLLAIRHLQVSITWRFLPLLASYNGERGVSNGFYDSSTWRRFWQLIAQDMRLTGLSVDIDYFGQDENLALDAEWVKPILEIKGIRYPNVTIRTAGRSSETFPGQAELFRQELITSMGRTLHGV